MLQEKTCTNCFAVKEISLFYNTHSQCKECIKDKRKERYSKNKTKELKKIKEYYHNNKDNILSYNKNYREFNSSKIKEQRHSYYKNNKEIIKNKVKDYRNINLNKVKVRESQWRFNNKIYKKKKDAEYRLKNKNNPVYKAKNNARLAKRRFYQLRATLIFLDYNFQNEIKQFYIKAKELEKSTKVKYHVDHIVPLLGKNVCGLHVPWNLQILEAKENLSKGNKYE